MLARTFTPSHLQQDSRGISLLQAYSSIPPRQKADETAIGQLRRGPDAMYRALKMMTYLLLSTGVLATLFGINCVS